MIVTNDLREFINECVDKHVPKGIHKYYHIDCQEHVHRSIEKLLEKDLIVPNDEVIEIIISEHWEELIIKQLSLLN